MFSLGIEPRTSPYEADVITSTLRISRYSVKEQCKCNARTIVGLDTLVDPSEGHSSCSVAHTCVVSRMVTRREIYI